MPASYTHISIAKDTIMQLTKESSCRQLFRKILDNRQLLYCYLAGAEGPDPLFFALIESKKENSSPAAGTLIHHEKTGLFLSKLLKEAADGADCLKAYTLGFLTHYGSDTIFHPYVYYHSFLDGKMISNKHCKFEHVLDVCIYRKQGNLSGLPVQMEGFKYAAKADKAEIASMLTKVIAEVFPENELTEKQVKNSFKMGVAFTGLLRKETIKKHSFLLYVAMKTPIAGLADSHIMPDDTRDNLLAEGDYVTKYYTFHNILNANGQSWYSCFEPDVERNESVDDLYEMAVVRDASFIRSAAAYFEGQLSLDQVCTIIGDMSYDSGLRWDLAINKEALE